MPVKIFTALIRVMIRDLSKNKNILVKINIFINSTFYLSYINNLSLTFVNNLINNK